MDYLSLAQKYQTPLYIYDFDLIKSKYEEFKKAFSARKSLICFAVKANSNLSVLKLLSDLGAGFDCVSLNEIKRAFLAGANKYKIIFSGVGKDDYELQEALKKDILLINVESFAELKRLEAIAKDLNTKARISIRVNPNIDAKTHPYISTGLEENKFGVNIDEARAMYIYAKKSEFLNPYGIHFHIGSQILDISSILQASKIISNFTRELRAIDIDIKFFDVGGGLGVDYEGDEKVDLYEYAQGILSSLNGQDLTIVCEPGRFILAHSGKLLSKVLYEKTNNKKRFVITDASMNDLLRPSLYGAKHHISALKDGEKSLCDVVGGICESGDFLGKDVLLPSLDNGDLLLTHMVGAYGFSMASNYNSRARAAEIAIENGKDRLIRKRESFDEIIANEKDLL